MKEAAVISWSGGKDSAMALYQLVRDKKVEIAGLLTTVSEGYDRISMHGVRRDLLNAQAKALGYPLSVVTLPQRCTYADYEERTLQALENYRRAGVTLMATGDLFLEYVRHDRERLLGKVGMRPIFPLWGVDTRDLAKRMSPLGFRSTVVCVNADALDRAYAGREYDASFVRDLPGDVDPCGENGEFHTFVYDAPVFRKPVEVQRGVRMMRENQCYYCDLRIPVVHAGERVEIPSHS